MSNALFRRFPELAALVPWIPLGRFPARIDTLDVERPGGGARTVLVMREDLCAEPYGGNKIRKLEFLLAEAKRRSATRLITVGAAGSHHALATTVHGRALGFDVTLVLFPQPLTPHVREVLLMDHALGARILWARRMELVPLTLLRARLAARADRAFIVAAGGSDAIGTLGWVSAGLELAESLQRIGRTGTDRPQCIHVAAGTLGTAAGLALGLAIAECDIPIAATRITSRLITNDRALSGLVHGAAAILARTGYTAPVERALAMAQIRQGQIGRGYGRGTPASGFALDSFAAAGLRLDDTYTAKAAAELLAGTDDPVLFVHTLSTAEPTDRIGEGGKLAEPVAAYLAQVPHR